MHVPDKNDMKKALEAVISGKAENAAIMAVSDYMKKNYPNLNAEMYGVEGQYFFLNLEGYWNLKFMITSDGDIPTWIIIVSDQKG